jgi:hypothetical protein
LLAFQFFTIDNNKLMKKATVWAPVAFGAGIVALMLALTANHLFHKRPLVTGESAPAEVIAPATDAESINAIRGRTAARARAGQLGQLDGPAQIRAIVAQRARAANEISAQNDRIKAAAASRYATEKQDVVWAAGKERALANVAVEVASASAAKPQGLNTDCKQTLCRTTATFGTPGAADEWVSLYMASMGGVMKRSVVSTVRNSQGTIDVDIYSVAQ